MQSSRFMTCTDQELKGGEIQRITFPHLTPFLNSPHLTLHNITYITLLTSHIITSPIIALPHLSLTNVTYLHLTSPTLTYLHLTYPRFTSPILIKSHISSPNIPYPNPIYATLRLSKSTAETSIPPPHPLGFPNSYRL